MKRQIRMPGDVSPSVGAAALGSLRATGCNVTARFAVSSETDRSDSVVCNITIHEIPDVAETSRLLAATSGRVRYSRGEWYFEEDTA